MRTIELGKSKMQVPVIASGCMRMNGLDEKQAAFFIEKALSLGVNFFEHADIYGKGECEKIFSKAIDMKPSVREKIILQSKCGIVPGKMYDLSKEHILKSVDEILKRLQTEYLDVLALHRPDALVEPEEVAEAFRILKESGKVRHFGVSNHKPLQMELLHKYLDEPLVTDQLQFSITNSSMVENGLEVNMTTKGAVDRDGSVLDYCRFHDITIQTWSPFQYGFFEGVFLNNEKFPELNQILKEIATRYEVTPTTIATAWILRHPAHMQVIAGTMNEKRLEEICKASEITLSREEWYQIYLAAGHRLP
ncbi:MAG TPA: aldo/keto reductase [Candidatus Scybalomonas excrementigallinarum]|nr:aldo/keto reductase [Candidatus Scybalomonas excrementigallinarum]